MKQLWKEAILTAIYGGLFICWLGIVGGYETDRLNMIQFLQATALTAILGVCVWTLADRNKEKRK